MRGVRYADSMRWAGFESAVHAHCLLKQGSHGIERE